MGVRGIEGEVSEVRGKKSIYLRIGKYTNFYMKSLIKAFGSLLSNRKLPRVLFKFPILRQLRTLKCVSRQEGYLGLGWIRISLEEKGEV